eukprot:scaffold444326_cov14-Prasinocladus_malaysianus.AAC.1
MSNCWRPFRSQPGNEILIAPTQVLIPVQSSNIATSPRRGVSTDVKGGSMACTRIKPIHGRLTHIAVQDEEEGNHLDDLRLLEASGDRLIHKLYAHRVDAVPLVGVREAF